MKNYQQQSIKLQNTLVNNNPQLFKDINNQSKQIKPPLINQIKPTIIKFVYNQPNNSIQSSYQITQNNNLTINQNLQHQNSKQYQNIPQPIIINGIPRIKQLTHQQLTNRPSSNSIQKERNHTIKIRFMNTNNQKIISNCLKIETRTGQSGRQTSKNQQKQINQMQKLYSHQKQKQSKNAKNSIDQNETKITSSLNEKIFQLPQDNRPINYDINYHQSFIVESFLPEESFIKKSSALILRKEEQIPKSLDSSFKQKYISQLSQPSHVSKVISQPSHASKVIEKNSLQMCHNVQSKVQQYQSPLASIKSIRLQRNEEQVPNSLDLNFKKKSVLHVSQSSHTIKIIEKNSIQIGQIMQSKVQQYESPSASNKSIKISQKQKELLYKEIDLNKKHSLSQQSIANQKQIVQKIQAPFKQLSHIQQFHENLENQSPRIKIKQQNLVFNQQIIESKSPNALIPLNNEQLIMNIYRGSIIDQLSQQSFQKIQDHPQLINLNEIQQQKQQENTSVQRHFQKKPQNHRIFSLQRKARKEDHGLNNNAIKISSKYQKISILNIPQQIKDRWNEVQSQLNRKTQRRIFKN